VNGIARIAKIAGIAKIAENPSSDFGNCHFTHLFTATLA